MPIEFTEKNYRIGKAGRPTLSKAKGHSFSKLRITLSIIKNSHI